MAPRCVVVPLVSLVALLTASTLDAQSTNLHSGAGLVMPVGEFSEYTSPGWMVFAGANRQIGDNPLLSWDATAFFGSVSHDDYEGDATHIPGFGVGGRYGAGAGVTRPYGGAMVGLLQHRYVSETFEEESETKPFVAIGGGVQGRVGSAALFADTRLVLASSTSFLSIVGGFTLGLAR
jgi:hypothetical protein